MKDLDQASTKTFGKQASPSVVIRGLQATDASRSYHIAVDEIGPSVRVDAANDGRDATEILDPAACEIGVEDAQSRHDRSQHIGFPGLNDLPGSIFVSPGAIPPPVELANEEASQADVAEPDGEQNAAGDAEPSEDSQRSQSSNLNVAHGEAISEPRIAQVDETPATPGPATALAPQTQLRVDEGAESRFEGHATREMEETKEFQAAWEVDRFRWPQVCDAFREQDWLEGLGTQLATANREGLRVMAVTSRRSGEGGTTLALCLARSAAQAGLRVALVDADLQSPNLAEQLGITVSATWTCALEGRVPMEEAGVYAIEDRITAFPLTRTAKRKGGTQLKQTADWLQQLPQSFDLVILDAGAQMANTHQLIAVNTADAIDAVTLVRDMRRTSSEEVEGVARRVYATGIEAVGIVENFGDWRERPRQGSA